LHFVRQILVESRSTKAETQPTEKFAKPVH
jgi:hypothetical protein